MDTLGPRTKNLSAPDETLSVEKGSASTVRIGELVVGRLALEPGWRWSQHVQPIAGTVSCQFHHVGLVLSGAMDGQMDDGTGLESGRGISSTSRQGMTTGSSATSR
ncbi:MAG: cupin domain-containing protein [Actinomycetota bacterium]